MKTVETHKGTEIRHSFLHEKYIVEGRHYDTLEQARASLEPAEIAAVLKPVKTDPPEEA